MKREDKGPMRRLDWAIAATSGTFMVGSVIAGLLIGLWVDKNLGLTRWARLLASFGWNRWDD
jgi:hypothetical protein